MDWMQYGINVLVAASSWFVGIMIARLIIRLFLTSDEPDGLALSGDGGKVSTDDVLDFDESDKPYIPVKIIREHGQYYAWFLANDKFIGQSAKLNEVKELASQHIFKQLGLRMTFEFDMGKKAPAKVRK